MAKEGVFVNFDLGKLAIGTPKEMAILINKVAISQKNAGQKGFELSKGPDDESWVANKPATVKRKGKNKPLIATGRAVRGFFVDGFATASKLSALIRFPRDRGEIMAIHQDGEGNNPQRRSIPEGGKVYKRSQKDVERAKDQFIKKSVNSVRITKRTG